jgi:hypothetical protein
VYTRPEHVVIQPESSGENQSRALRESELEVADAKGGAEEGQQSPVYKGSLVEDDGNNDPNVVSTKVSAVMSFSEER